MEERMKKEKKLAGKMDTELFGVSSSILFLVLNK